MDTFGLSDNPTYFWGLITQQIGAILAWDYFDGLLVVIAALVIVGFILHRVRDLLVRG